MCECTFKCSRYKLLHAHTHTHACGRRHLPVEAWRCHGRREEGRGRERERERAEEDSERERYIHMVRYSKSGEREREKAEEDSGEMLHLTGRDPFNEGVRFIYIYMCGCV